MTKFETMGYEVFKLTPLEENCANILGGEFLQILDKKICFEALHGHGMCKGGNCGIQPTLSSLTKDCPNPNNYPNPIRKQDLNSSLAAVSACVLVWAVFCSCAVQNSVI